MPYSPARPRTRSRGPVRTAISDVHRRDRTPLAWSIATNTESSTRLPGRRLSICAKTPVTSPNSRRLWSTRWAPRSRCGPPASSAVSRHSVADRRPALETRLEAVDRAEDAILDQGSDGLEVAVPPPVLVDRQDPSRALAGFDQRLGLRDAHRDRLVHDDVVTRCERLLADRGVRPVGRHDDDDLHVRVRQERVDRIDDLGVGVIGQRLCTATRVRRRDRPDPEPVDGVDVGRMEESSGQPVPDHADADVGRRRHARDSAGQMLAWPTARKRSATPRAAASSSRIRRPNGARLASKTPMPMLIERASSASVCGSMPAPVVGLAVAEARAVERAALPADSPLLEQVLHVRVDVPAGRRRA